MTNTLVIILIIIMAIILLAVVYLYIDSLEVKKLSIKLAEEYLAIARSQTEIERLDQEMNLKQFVVFEDMAVNFENKLNQMRQELDWYTQNFEEWKISYQEHFGLIENGRVK